MLFGFFELRLAPDRAALSCGGAARPARSGRTAVLDGRPKGGRSADPSGAPVRGRSKLRAGAARTAARQPRQPNHHPERFVDRLGVTENARHIRIKRNGSIARGRPQALAERRIAARGSGAAGARRAGKDRRD